MLSDMDEVTKTHATAVVVIPPLELWPPIQAIRRQYDRQFRRWMPHITLLYPFRPVERFDEIAPALRDCCATIEPFEIELKTFHYFQHHPRSLTMWLAPEPPEPVTALQAALQPCAPDCTDVTLHEGGFRPHLSVGQARSITELEKQLGPLQAEFEPIRFTVSEIAMIRRGPDKRDIFKVDRLIPIGAALS
ncbi:MAG: 2'-5' RNA ligase family protein [Phycisphaerae bacterium]|nr:2'-5' RNA ligase family protein [Phycisphaerae bacterium]